MTEYLCYKIVIKNPGAIMKMMLDENDIEKEIYLKMRAFHMKCDGISVKEVKC